MKNKIKFVLATMIAITTLSSCGGIETSDNSVNQESILTESSSIGNDGEDISEESMSSESTVESKETKNTDEANYPLIEDIDWSVDELIDDGERKVMMSVNNNSKYTIKRFEINFFEKEDLSEEQIDEFYNDLKKAYGSEEDDVTDLKDSVKGISMRSEIDSLIPIHGSKTNIDLYYFKGYYYMKSLKHYQLVKPDIAEIEFIDQNVVKTVYYDFHSGKYNMGAKTETLNTWSNSELANVIPVLEDKFIENESDRNNSLRFDVRAVSLNEYNNYVEMCKNAGFTISSSDSNYSDHYRYSANKSDGYNLSLSYEESKEELSISVEKMSMWTDSALTEMIPKMDKYISDKSEYEGNVSFTVCNVSLNECKDYAQKCKEKGFTLDSDEYSDENYYTYYANNSDNYRLTINYNNNDSVFIMLEKNDQ